MEMRKIIGIVAVGLILGGLFTVLPAAQGSTHKDIFIGKRAEDMMRFWFYIDGSKKFKLCPNGYFYLKVKMTYNSSYVIDKGVWVTDYPNATVVVKWLVVTYSKHSIMGPEYHPINKTFNLKNDESAWVERRVHISKFATAPSNITLELRTHVTYHGDTTTPDDYDNLWPSVKLQIYNCTDPRATGGTLPDNNGGGGSSTSGGGSAFLFGLLGGLIAGVVILVAVVLLLRNKGRYYQ